MQRQMLTCAYCGGNMVLISSDGKTNFHECKACGARCTTKAKK